MNTTMKLSFKIYRYRRDGAVERRFHKFRYTVALRLGAVPKVYADAVEFDFNGVHAVEVKAHNGNEAFLGDLRIDHVAYKNIILIARCGDRGYYKFITFWPISQHADAHESYTDPLVDTAMDGTPFDIEVVATKMYAQFQLNAGVSPATLMKKIYEDESEQLRDSANKLGDLIEEALQISKIETERADREKTRADEYEVEAEFQRKQAEHERVKSERLKIENEQLRKAAYIEPPTDDSLVISDKIQLERAYEGVQGKFNQRAVVLLLSDGSTRSNNWKYGFAERLAYAKSLEGKYIKTDVWGGYDGKKWFKNIYLQNE